MAHPAYRWTLAVVGSLVVHGAAIAYGLTVRNEPPPADSEAGASSAQIGSVEAILGIEQALTTAPVAEIATVMPTDRPTPPTPPVETRPTPPAPTEVKPLTATPVEIRPTEAVKPVVTASPQPAPVVQELHPTGEIAALQATDPVDVDPVEVATPSENIAVVPEPTEAAAEPEEVQEPEPDVTPMPRERPDHVEPKRTVEKPEPRKPEPRLREPKPAVVRKGTEAESRAGASSAAVAAVDTGAGTFRGAAEGRAMMSSYQSRVLARIRSARRYPEAARSDGLQGTVTVAFTITASGGLANSRLVASSGSPLLDRAALETLSRAAPFPPPPPELGGTLPFQVPIRFDLR